MAINRPLHTGIRKADIWKRTSPHPDYAGLQWWEYNIGDRTMSVTPWTVVTEAPPTDAEREAAGQLRADGL